MGGGRDKRRNSCLCVFCNPLKSLCGCCQRWLRQLLCSLLSTLTDLWGDKSTKYTSVPKDDNDIPMNDIQCAPSYYTVENVRYHLGEPPKVEHSNEDRCFVAPKASTRYQVVALFDGHDGLRAVDHVYQFVRKRLNMATPESVNETTLKNVFLETERNFFETIRVYVEERQALEAIIPPGMKSYQASQQYPGEVARLVELEPLIAGGCTAVVAVVCGNKLHVANVGDSRAVVVYQTPNGTLETLQLSTDHDVKNVDELKRLEQLGLDPEELKRVGRLGPQENTRSIGDYNIKEGYKSVDILSHASGPPGTAEPSVITVDIEESFLYLMVMSDGVYKSIEAAVDKAQTIGANQVLANMVHASAQTPGVEFSSIAQSTLDQVAHLHEEAFLRSPKATACRKRDDMTLIVCTFYSAKF